MATANAKILDAEISHQIDLQQYSNGVVRKIIGVLNRTDTDLFAQLTAALQRLDPESFTVERLESLLRSVRAINVQAYQAVGKDLTGEMRGLVAAETAFQHDLFLNVLPVQLKLNTVTVESAYTAAMSRPFQGRLLKEWTSSIEADRMARIRDTVRIGYVEGLPTSEIVRRVRGTRAKGFSDGIIEIDRRHAEAVVRTSVGHTASTTRERFHDANADLIKALGWTSTLDSRTSEICRIRDGKHYHPKTHAPIGHKLPWLGGPGKAHWGCRSCSVPILKSWKELGAAADVEEFSPATRASMDGQVPADQTYGEWLKKQSPARQDQILGKTRGEMFRKGDMSLDKFYNDKGQWLTLEQLQARTGVKAPPAPPPVPTARGTFDTSTEAGRWHQKSFNAAPDWLRDVVAREQAVQVEFRGGTAYAARSLAINMGDVQVNEDGRTIPAIDSLARQSTWRHEFGHILDARLAAGRYRSSERDFPAAQHTDAVLLEAAAGKGRPSQALTAAQDARAAEYLGVADTVIDAPNRDKALEGLANRAGVDYKQFMSVVAESTLLENTGIGYHVRIGKMLKAVELGDAEEFIRQAVFLTPQDLQPANDVWKLRHASWRKDGAFAALSDLVGSATRNKVAGHHDGFFGHSDAYYAQASLMAPTESFANLTALAGHANRYWWELVKRFAPNMAREFEAIIRKVA